MFAVFHKNQFQDWWLNPIADKTWVERTLAAKAWEASDVKVYWFPRPPALEDVIGFNEDFSLSILEQKDAEVEVNGEIQVKKIWTEKEKRSGQLFYDKGEKKEIF